MLPPSDDKMMLIKIRPSIIASTAAIFPPLWGIMTLLMYCLEGRYANYIPTISETGTEYPNSNLFAEAMATGGITTMFTEYIYASYYIMRYGASAKWTRWFYTLSITTALGCIGLGFAPINERRFQHYFFAFTGFMSILLFEFTICAKMWNVMATWQKVIRLSFPIIASIGFLSFGFAELIFPVRTCVSLSTIGEYCLLIFSLSVFHTWGPEMNSVRIYVVALD